MGASPKSMEQLMDQWIHLIEPSRKQLFESKELLNKLRTMRGPDSSPSAEEVELESLIHQLTSTCQQTEAQFSVIQQATKERDRAAYECNLQKLINSLNGWSSFLGLDLIEKKDFLHQWLSSMGIHQDTKNPELFDSLGMFPKNVTACRAWERHLLLPRKISTMMEVGSSFGVNAIYLSRMLRMSASEPRPAMISLAKNLEKAHPFFSFQPPIDFNRGAFHPKSANTLPIDSFDAIWFHRQAWTEWIRQDGPHLFSALGELFHLIFYLITLNDTNV
jgi:hypothetical protein